MTSGAPHLGTRTGIVIVNYGSHDLIESNYGMLATDVQQIAVVVVVDNFTSTSEAKSIAELCTRKGWLLVLNDTNIGFGAGVNVGVARAREVGCSTFLLANPDAMILVSDIENLASRVLADPLVMISPQIVKEDGTRWFDGGSVLIEKGRTSTVEGSDSGQPHGWLSGACLMLHEQMWLQVGGFDDRYFLYWEDVDLSFRWVASGGTLKVADDIKIVHRVGGTQGGFGKSPAYVYHNCRNRLLFASIHLTRSEALRWLRGSVGYAASVVQRGGRRALLAQLGALLWAAVRGTVAGAIIIRRARTSDVIAVQHPTL